MSRQRGIVLLTTMFMLAGVALLIGSLMQGILIYIKSSHQVIANHKMFRKMDMLSKTIDITNINCITKEQDPNRVIDHLFAEQGCLLIDDHDQYRYLIEDLGLYDCLQIKVGDLNLASHHWRLTLVSMQFPYLTLQSQIAVPQASEPCKLSTPHFIPQGVVSWRTLTRANASN